MESSNGMLTDADSVGTCSSRQASKLFPTASQKSYDQEANPISFSITVLVLQGKKMLNPTLSANTAFNLRNQNNWGEEEKFDLKPVAKYLSSTHLAITPIVWMNNQAE